MSIVLLLVAGTALFATKKLSDKKVPIPIKKTKYGLRRAMVASNVDKALGTSLNNQNTVPSHLSYAGTGAYYRNAGDNEKIRGYSHRAEGSASDRLKRLYTAYDEGFNNSLSKSLYLANQGRPVVTSNDYKPTIVITNGFYSISSEMLQVLLKKIQRKWTAPLIEEEVLDEPGRNPLIHWKNYQPAAERNNKRITLAAKSKKSRSRKPLRPTIPTKSKPREWLRGNPGQGVDKFIQL